MNRVAVLTYEPNQTLQKVVAIKAVRAITSWGLKETKHFVDELPKRPNSFQVPNQLSEEDLSRRLHEINTSGYSIKIHSEDSPVRRELNKQINSTLAYASLAGQHDIVRALTNVLETHLYFNLTEDNQE